MIEGVKSVAYTCQVLPSSSDTATALFTMSFSMN